MTKKELFFPVIFIGLSIVFVVVSIGVFASKGKSSKWIARKMKIGALMLTFSSIVSCDTADNNHVTCYDVPEMNSIWIEGATYQGINLRLDSQNVLKGTIGNRNSDKFSYSVSDSNHIKILSDNIKPKDGVFDSITENFELVFQKDIPKGNYILNLFLIEQTKQDSLAMPAYSYKLFIK